jgi:hypothetical protein
MGSATTGSQLWWVRAELRLRGWTAALGARRSCWLKRFEQVTRDQPFFEPGCWRWRIVGITGWAA